MPGALVLVSGATGYIGSHVIRELLDNGYRVRGTVRNLKKPAPHLEAWIANGDALELVEADLGEPQGWPAACQGCDLVAHVASPFFMGCKPSEAEEKLYKPAREGTLTVLRAAKDAGSVKRVVLTSSIAAIMVGHTNAELEAQPEDLWSDEDKCEPYLRSKTMAEKAAWDFVDENPGCFELSVVNPGLVIGPPLSSGDAQSHRIVRRFIMHELPAIPDYSQYVVDVRDVAIGHRLALEKPDADGKRFALVAGQISFLQIAKALKAEFSQYGYNVPTFRLPYLFLWFASLYDKEARSILPEIGLKLANFNNSKARTELGMDFRDSAQSVVEHVHGCLQLGVKGFKKTAKYKRAFPAQSQALVANPSSE
ncbi:Dihydroflavonol 4-reductase [Hondaea fermentalgiana]|uniref:Dihydroflavonol 4-reductase n=1 Tax=Hondaea fermentalgiana TaxID=2315210 RepID=A0A2R5G722_9STRA|nr:Dihydroflavonol 4-reductase [Hondaea fermentalgiana]|eukprot:GBG25588.1 Dihydroflavonol 4-reductase [Hondaea fermentalgiana]